MNPNTNLVHKTYGSDSGDQPVIGAVLFDQFSNAAADTNPFHRSNVNSTNELLTMELVPTAAEYFFLSGNPCKPYIIKTQTSAQTGRFFGITDVLKSYQNSISLVQFKRLNRLIENAKSDTEEPQINQSSLLGYLSFIKRFQVKVDPFISISKDGYILAMWDQEDGSQNISIQFESQKDCLIVGFFGDESNLKSGSSEAIISELIHFIKAFQGLDLLKIIDLG